MRVSNRGLLKIAEHEGVVPAPYFDSAGVATWGIGHTAAAGAPRPDRMARGMPENIDAAIWKVFDLFRKDISKYENRVNDAIKVPLKQYEFDALVSFDWNTGGIHRATLTKRINAKDPLAYESFMGWLKPPEIKERRTAEMDLFHTGDYNMDGSSIQIWKADKKGALKGIISSISGQEALTRMGRAPNPSEIHPQGPVSAPESPLPIDLPDATPNDDKQPTGLMAALAALVAFILKLLGRK